jgi:methylmalonyl-CoA/ethylmalonyl-CoA epimerase
MAYPPRSVAGKLEKAPSNLPIGVRAPPRRTDAIQQLYTALLATESGRWNNSAVTSRPPTEPDWFPGLGAVDHVGVAVADLEAALDFHTRVLGLAVLHREQNPGQGVVEVMLSGEATARPSTQLQLLSPLNDSSPLHRFLLDRGPGLHHVAYQVVDVRTASEVLQQRGLRLIYDAPRAGTRGSLINFVHPRDTGGVLIELVEPLP